MIILLTGVSGTGKTTVGTRLAETLSIPFFDADAFHSNSNIRKMSSGIPLTDEDRWDWLYAIRRAMDDFTANTASAVFACSALKASYRTILTKGIKNRILLILLFGDFELIKKRMKMRPGHYMKDAMLSSQFRDLEEPDDALKINVELPVNTIADEIRTVFRQRQNYL